MGKPNSRKAALKRKAVVVPTEPKTVSATALLKKLRPSSDGEEKEEHPEPVKEPVSVDQPEPVIPTQPKTVSAIDLLKKLRPSTEEKEEEKPAEPEEECPLAEDFCLSDLVTDPVWKEALLEEFSAPYFLELQKQLAKDYAAGKQIFPEKQFIFHAFNSTPLDKIKVVILGQDPYHDDGQAHGLSFSVPRGVKPPPSLKNIYKELSVDIPWFQPPHHGCLQTWADGGIMLLNATLTVLAHKPNSHSKYGWQTFTDSVIRLISRKCQGVVFILWGLFAQKKECLINLSKHSIIKAAHPSPLSVKKFLGCKCFSQANAALVKAGRSPVDWAL